MLLLCLAAFAIGLPAEMLKDDQTKSLGAEKIPGEMAKSKVVAATSYQ